MMYMWTHTHYRVSPPYKSQPESYCLTVPVSSLSIQHVQVHRPCCFLRRRPGWHHRLSFSLRFGRSWPPRLRPSRCGHSRLRPIGYHPIRRRLRLRCRSSGLRCRPCGLRCRPHCSCPHCPCLHCPRGCPGLCPSSREEH